MPAGYLDRPELNESLEYVWDAFWTLNSDRPLGIGEGPIPFTSIDRFAQRYGIDNLDDFDEFRSLIHAIDGEYLKFRSEQSKNKDADMTKGKPI